MGNLRWSLRALSDFCSIKEDVITEVHLLLRDFTSAEHIKWMNFSVQLLLKSQ